MNNINGGRLPGALPNSKEERGAPPQPASDEKMLPTPNLPFKPRELSLDTDIWFCMEVAHFRVQQFRLLGIPSREVCGRELLFWHGNRSP
jgi:hypothetical protein